MNVFAQWLFMFVTFSVLIFLAIKGRNLNNKKILFLLSIGMLVFYIIDTYGTIGADKSMNIIMNIAMWISIICFSAFFIYLKDIKRLAMVLYIPGVFILLRFIEIAVPKISN